jgi:ankyrin repeat protein
MGDKTGDAELFNFTAVPLDILKLIVYEQPRCWLIVTKYLGAYAKKILKTDPRFHPDSIENKLLRQAIQKKNIQDVKHCLATGRADPAVYRNWPLRFAAADGCVELVELLMQQPTVNPTACKHESLVYACRNRHCDIVEILLKDKRVDPSCNQNQPIKEAIRSGGGRSMKAIVTHPRYMPMDNVDFSMARDGFLRADADAVKIILEMNAAIPGVGSELLSDMTNAEGVEMLIENGADPSVLRQRLIRNAVVYDRYEMVRYLLTVPQVDPAAQTDWCICFAAESGNTKMVKLLLADPRVDPTARDNYPLRHACQRGQIDVVEVLLNDPRVNPAGGSERKPLTHVMIPSKEYSVYPAVQNREEPKLSEKLQIIKKLLSDPRVDPTWGKNQALRVAFEAKSADQLIIQIFILPAVNPHEIDFHEFKEEFNATPQSVEECFAKLLKNKLEAKKEVSTEIVLKPQE